MECFRHRWFHSHPRPLEMIVCDGLLRRQVWFAGRSADLPSIETSSDGNGVPSMRFHFGTLHHEIMPSPFPSALGLFWRFLSVSVSPDPAFYPQHPHRTTHSTPIKRPTVAPSSFPRENLLRKNL